MKDFDVNSPTNGLPTAEGTELAGVSDDRPTTDVIDLSKATQVFPVTFDKSARVKDFRAQETIESSQVPKDGSALASASGERFSSTSPTGLEDVSPEDQLDPTAPPTTVLTSAATVS